MTVSHTVTKAVLMRARTMISDPKNWTRGAFRRQRARSGIPADRWDKPEAFAYCAIGAIQQATNRWGNDDLLDISTEQRLQQEQAAQRALREAIPGGMPIDSYNDRQATHPQILAAFDRAIEAEGRKARWES